MIEKQDLEKMKVIQIADKTYLGFVEELEGNNGVTIKNGLIVDEFKKETFASWIKLENIGLLECIQLKGFIAYSMRELNENEETDFEECLNIMKKSRKKAIAHLENDVYDKLSGKRG